MLAPIAPWLLKDEDRCAKFCINIVSCRREKALDIVVFTLNLKSGLLDGQEVIKSSASVYASLKSIGVSNGVGNGCKP